MSSTVGLFSPLSGMMAVARIESSYAAHILKNISLILISLVFLPLTFPTFFFLYTLSFSSLTSPSTSRGRSYARDKASEDGEITVLITGVSMQKGLTLARLFYLYGFQQPDGPQVRVIGADFSSLAMGAVSKSISKFYKLTPPSEADDEPYIESLLHIVQRERVHLWVSCSGVASAVEDGVARDTIMRVTGGGCQCVQFGGQDTAMLHEKDKFMQAVTQAGLEVPETHIVTERSQVDLALANHYSTGKTFIIKPLGVVDKYRADMTKLPLETRPATQKHIVRIPISHKDPFVLQEFIDGKEYCTHAVILKGKVAAFVACESASVLMHYVALPKDSPLTGAMLKFTTRMASWAQEQAEERGEGSEFTGHMSFDFLVRREDETRKDGNVRIWPIECNPRTHTAVVLFDGQHAVRMIEPYIDYVQQSRSKEYTSRVGSATGESAGESDSEIVYGAATHSYYWLPHDLIVFVLLPLYGIIMQWVHQVIATDSPKRRLPTATENMRSFLVHIAVPSWKDASLEFWDPLPAWWLWHVYWPSKFLNCLRQGYRWSEVNVSTGKVFGC